MNKLEPTYLRYIHDELNKGSISSDNASSLPLGFTGLFEKEFSENISVLERTDLLNKFGLWALLNKSVSLELYSLISNTDIVVIQKLVNKYSKWFNSNEPGKYILFHDRLRVFFLQKLSNHEIKNLNEKLIGFLSKSLSNQNNQEAETYALEYLGNHLLIESKINGKFNPFIDFVLNDEIIKKQIDFSNEYKWSKRDISNGIIEAARVQSEYYTVKSTIKLALLKQDEVSGIYNTIDVLRKQNIDSAINRCSADKSHVSLLILIHELLYGKSISEEFKKIAISKILQLFDGIKEYDFPEIPLYNYYTKISDLNIDSNILWEKIKSLENRILNLLQNDSVDFATLEKIATKNFDKLDLIGFYRVKLTHVIEKSDPNLRAILNKLLHLINEIDFEYFEGLFENTIYESYKFKEEVETVTGRFSWQIDSRNINNKAKLFLEWNNFNINLKNDIFKAHVALNDFQSAEEVLRSEMIEIFKKVVKFFEENIENFVLNDSFDGELDELVASNQLIISNYFKLYNYYPDLIKEIEIQNHLITNIYDRNKDKIKSTLSAVNFTYNKVLFNKLFLQNNKNLWNNITDLESFLKKSNEYEKIKILLAVYEGGSIDKDKIELISKYLEKVIDGLKYGVDKFNSLENIFMTLSKNGYTSIGKYFILKAENLINRLSNKDQKFYYSKLYKIITGYIYCNEIDKVKENIDLLILSLERSKISVESSDPKVWWITIKGIDNWLRMIATDAFEVFNIELAQALYIYIYSIYKERNIPTAALNNKYTLYLIDNDKAIPLERIRNEKALILSSFSMDSMNQNTSYKSSKYLKLFSQLENQELVDLINVLQKNAKHQKGSIIEKLGSSGPFCLIMNVLFSKDINAFFLNYTRVISEHHSYPLFVRTDEIASRINYLNLELSKELTKKLNYKDGVKVIKSFNFKENIHNIHPSLTREKLINPLLQYYFNRLGENTTSNNGIIEDIFNLIENLESKENEYRRINNKKLGYYYAASKFKEYGHKEMAVRILKRYEETFNLVEIQLYENLISDKELLEKVESYVNLDYNYSHSEVEDRLEAITLIGEIGFKQKFIGLIQNLFNQVHSNKDMYGWEKEEFISRISRTIYHSGEFELADKIFSYLPEKHNFGSVHNFTQEEAKREYFDLRNNKSKKKTKRKVDNENKSFKNIKDQKNNIPSVKFGMEAFNNTFEYNKHVYDFIVKNINNKALMDDYFINAMKIYTFFKQDDEKKKMLSQVVDVGNWENVKKTIEEISSTDK